MRRGSILGYDLNEKNCQISYYDEKKDEPETECEDNRQSESNKPKAAANSVKTGDDTPLMTFVLLLLCSASCMMLLAGRRKKEDGQDR